VKKILLQAVLLAGNIVLVRDRADYCLKKQMTIKELNYIALKTSFFTMMFYI